MAHGSKMDEEGVRLAELAALIEYKLGEPLDKAAFSELASIQLSLWRSQEKLSSELLGGKLKEEQYLEYLNRAIKDAMIENQKVLGFERFKIIFGDAGYRSEQMIDPDIFLKQRPTEPHKSR